MGEVSMNKIQMINHMRVLIGCSLFMIETKSMLSLYENIFWSHQGPFNWIDKERHKIYLLIINRYLQEVKVISLQFQVPDVDGTLWQIDQLTLPKREGKILSEWLAG